MLVGWGSCAPCLEIIAEPCFGVLVASLLAEITCYSGALQSFLRERKKEKNRLLSGKFLCNTFWLNNFRKRVLFICA